MCKQKHGHAEGLKLDLNLIFDMTNFNDDIFWNDRTKSLVGLGTMLFVRLSMDRRGLCKYRNAFQLPWPAWAISEAFVSQFLHIIVFLLPLLLVFVFSLFPCHLIDIISSTIPLVLGWLQEISGAMGFFLIAAA